MEYEWMSTNPYWWSVGPTGYPIFTNNRLTKMARFSPSKINCNGKDISKLLITEVFTKHVIPKSIISVRDPKFASKIWTKVFKTLVTKWNLSSGDHPQTDGQIERVNQVMEDMLRSHVASKQSNWEERLPFVEFAYNNSKHSSIGMAPFRVMFGYVPLIPLDLDLKNFKGKT